LIVDRPLDVPVDLDAGDLTTYARGPTSPPGIDDVRRVAFGARDDADRVDERRVSDGDRQRNAVVPIERGETLAIVLRNARAAELGGEAWPTLPGKRRRWPRQVEEADEVERERQRRIGETNRRHRARLFVRREVAERMEQRRQRVRVVARDEEAARVR